MLDIKLLRENPDLVKENIKKKNQNDKVKLVDEAIKKDADWRKLKSQVDSLRSDRNKISKEINDLKKAGKNTDISMKKAQKIPDEIDKIEKKVAILEEEVRKILWNLPNIISKQTPIGKDASENKEIKKEGKIPKFDFSIKTHVELAEALDLADFSASAKTSGNGFYYLKGDLACLNQALISFALDKMQKKGYLYVETPLMLNEKSIFASMDKAAIEQSIYHVEGEDLNLIGTAEQSLLAMYMGQTIPEWELPKRYISYSMCFRKEVGSHGINEKGLWRTHQFNKVEQFIFCSPEESEKYYEELLKNSEDILNSLELPYRIVEMCSGDLADWKYRSADFEIYRPTTKEYGEVMSLSNCTDYQARRLNIKCIDKRGNKKILHTLNNTAIATSRIMVAILENYQQKDGSILIPKILVPYVNGKKKIETGKR
ncbi:MAG: serine--tRNA ligase [Nanoarchaeota archaeon]